MFHSSDDCVGALCFLFFFPCCGQLAGNFVNLILVLNSASFIILIFLLSSAVLSMDISRGGISWFYFRIQVLFKNLLKIRCGPFSLQSVRSISSAQFWWVLQSAFAPLCTETIAESI